MKGTEGRESFKLERLVYRAKRWKEAKEDEKGENSQFLMVRMTLGSLEGMILL